jgi:cutinase
VAVTALFAVVALLIGPSPAAPLVATASAESCPDVEVIFARGTNDAPGLGRVGDAFVGALRSKVPGRDIGAYAVNYPASYNFLQAADGANDASGHVQYMVDNCPATRLVLGGYSQGAAVIDIVAAAPVPGFGFTSPLPPEAAVHVAAVAVFGNPSDRLGQPLTSSPAYGFKTIDLCAAGDPICSDGRNFAAHSSSYTPGLTNQAASFVAGLL